MKTGNYTNESSDYSKLLETKLINFGLVDQVETIRQGIELLLNQFVEGALFTQQESDAALEILANGFLQNEKILKST